MLEKMAQDEHQTASDINTKLLAAFIEWEKKSRFIDIARENNLSRPHVCSVTGNYIHSQKRIMIIGQEPKDFPLFNANWSEQDIQTWGIEYVEKQIWNIGSQGYNNSPFWDLFRYVEGDIGYCPCWNNVDKAHRIIDGKTNGLPVALEKSLNATVLSNGFTILQEEISIAKPNAVLYITGPDYYQSMATAMKIDEKELSLLKPTLDCLCSDISEISQIGLPVLWAYHPSFLKRKELFSKAKSEISGWLSDK